MAIFFEYIVIINIIGLLAMFFDKQKAIKGKWRTKEKTLFMISLFGGSIGVFFGMYAFHHKTKHNSFIYGIPLIMILQIVLLFLYIFKTYI